MFVMHFIKCKFENFKLINFHLWFQIFLFSEIHWSIKYIQNKAIVFSIKDIGGNESPYRKR